MEKAIVAAGCFWGVEEAFFNKPGVTATTVGYTGGTVPNPTYREVCTGKTGHAEAVLVEYDPSKVTYQELVDFFFAAHDPTTLNRQGPDHGTQYRSAIFCFSPDQEKVAHAAKDQVQAKLGKEVVTQIVPVATFFRAEDYHQKYLQKHGSHC